MLPSKPNDPTYLNQRLTELGITPEQNTFERVWYQDGPREEDGVMVHKLEEQRRTYQIFDCNEIGDIVIRYFNLQGQPYRWKKEDTKFPREFVRRRLKEPLGTMKYSQDSGSPLFPFFPPGLIKKYGLAKKFLEDQKAGKGKEGEENPGQVALLVITEGEFKAFKGEMCGIDIVGLPGIHGFYNGDIKGRLHEDIEDLIRTCQVQKIIFLYDADLFTIKWEEAKDLSKRPNSFYGSIKAFRESLQLLIDDDECSLEYAYLMSIKIKFLNDAKGLDDLLCKYSNVTVEICNDLAKLQFANKYFTGNGLNDLNKDVQGRVYKELGLMDEQDFYKTYSDFIGSREFKFKRRRYIYDNEKKEVVFVRHEDAEKFMRIGPDWVKVISRLNKYGEKEEEIVSWKISEIQRDYKKFPDFLDQIMKYDGFCNEPSWNGAYQRVIQGCYNVCEPLSWQPKAGSITNTIKFLKHIFQGNGMVTLDANGMPAAEDSVTGDQFTVALDYITILIKHPKHMLPVPILVSPENGTGKSTFLKWLQILFGSNMCILGNDQFKMKFNGHYITKFIIAIDEGFLEVDKKAEKERLKQLVTADRAFLEYKGMNVREINYYGKLLICSNDADRVMKIDEGESRWFVVRVPQIPRIELTGQQLIDRGYKNFRGETIDQGRKYEVMDADPDLERKLREEMPAFLHFIYNRQIHHPRVNRLWFDPEWFITEQFKLIVETTKNRVDRVFEHWMREQFLLYRLPVLRYSLKFLTDTFNDPKTSKYKIDEIELKAYIQERRKMEPGHPQRIDIPIGFDLDNLDIASGVPKVVYKKDMARAYKFVAEDWLNETQLKQMQQPLTQEEVQTGKVAALASAVQEDLPF